MADVDLSTIISAAGIFCTVIAGAIAYGVTRNKVNTNSAEIKDLREIVRGQEKDLSQFKNEVAQDYVSLTNLSSFEARMSGLEERMVSELAGIRETLTTFLTSLAVNNNKK